MGKIGKITGKKYFFNQEVRFGVQFIQKLEMIKFSLKFLTDC